MSGASVGMFVIPFLLQYLLNTYGLRGTTLLQSCLWLSVALVGILFRQTVMKIEGNQQTLQRKTTTSITVSREDSVLSQGQSNKLANRLIHRQRTSFCPISVYSHQEKHPQFSSICHELHQIDKLPIHTTITTHEEITSSPRSVEIIRQG